MKTYRLVFRIDSPLTRIPDAQTIFGAICNIIKNIDSEASLLKYLDSFESDKPYLIHSSMFLYPLFPMIKKSMYSIEYINYHVLKQEPENQLEYLNKMKQAKKISFVSERVFKDYLLNNRFEQLKNDYIGKNENFELCQNILKYKDEDLNYVMKENLNVRVRTDIKDIENGENRDLFFEQTLYFGEKTRTQIFVKSDLDKEQIRKLFKYVEYFGIGNKISVGKNLYVLETIEELNLKSEKSNKILLSKCISKLDEFDYMNSSYQMVTNSYVSSYNYVKEGHVGNFTAILEGSLMKVNEEKEYYGKMLKSNVKGKNIFHYGIGFVL